MPMEVICLEDAALQELVEQVIARIKEKHNVRDKWISPEDAMKKLNITSNTTLQKYRDEGRIRFSQRDRRNILYDIDSIDDYLEKHAKDTF